ncbi:MAG: phosphonopyruvate decarboxylase, partial [Deltaproteobacteria bacterium]
MIDAQEFILAALNRGFSFFTGVPCSFLKPLINYVISHQGLKYVTAASEGEALGIAGGAYLGGKRTVVMCQNSGLGNMVNPLTSLNYPFRLPALLIVTLRGEPGLNDEPQHELMGQITENLLNTLGVGWEYFPGTAPEIEPLFQRLEAYFDKHSLPFALVMKKDMVAKIDLASQDTASETGQGAISGRTGWERAGRLPRIEALRLIRANLSARDALIATTGKTGRELYTLGDSENQLYVVGSMGCASGIGLGVQLTLPRQRVVVLDGDGAALMKLGTLATIGHYRPAPFIHIILDNEVYDSTGGQPTLSGTVDFAKVALAVGYSRAYRIITPDELVEALGQAVQEAGPVLLHVK